MIGAASLSSYKRFLLHLYCINPLLLPLFKAHSQEVTHFICNMYIISKRLKGPVCKDLAASSVTVADYNQLNTPRLTLPERPSLEPEFDLSVLGCCRNMATL